MYMYENMFLCVCGHVNGCTCVYMWGVFINHFTLVFGQGLPLILELANLTRLTGQQPRDPPVLISSHWIYRCMPTFYLGSRDQTLIIMHLHEQAQIPDPGKPQWGLYYSLVVQPLGIFQPYFPSVDRYFHLSSKQDWRLSEIREWVLVTSLSFPCLVIMSPFFPFSSFFSLSFS